MVIEGVISICDITEIFSMLCLELSTQWYDNSQCCVGGLGASRVDIVHATVPWE
ncbi:hypothetical protein [Anaplasma phagocytophilum]|uniref:Uncharacterized protein n=4 Tax=Anaplasma phagocytophilum TaxID=948 RepID=Q2GKL9_ANAPZ|nr:hypothetical protein [Anaplasma phagocytophilum]KJV66856.1 hypothetical protein APHNP_1697 [Anaplasma phagocytophilum str. ApNP]KKA00875.1 hypothetical protein APHCR_1494 [Anaplasma phagocytophilum str. CR1007]ABD44472.1 hypothetical protein APH_0483 [Anaplasma phagocytophilum str. HZ]AGR79341.1 hypothetical protein YYU_02375 [Anaplasma phagocytophilum str. HZ2]AGR80586.1 hypothetical protein WSQ_02365 [Anaplasma phagocytophilum str. JM]